MLPDEQTSPEQIAIFRRMSGERRLHLAEQLYWSARRMKSAWLRSQHPDWPDKQVEAEVTRIFRRARTRAVFVVRAAPEKYRVLLCAYRASAVHCLPVRPTTYIRPKSQRPDQEHAADSRLSRDPLKPQRRDGRREKEIVREPGS